VNPADSAPSPVPPADSHATFEQVCLGILAVIATATAAKFLSGVLAPLAMAVFLAVVIQSFANSLERLLGQLLPGGRRFGMPAALLITIVLFGVLLVLTIDNASAFASKLVSYAPRLNDLISRLAGALHTASVPTLDELLLQLNPGAYLASAAGVVRNLAADTVLILIYLGFILASGRAFERKVLNLSTERGERRTMVIAYRSILGSVEQYLWVQTITGLMIAAASWVAMTMVGLDGATFLAVLIFLACYIPILGAALGVVIAPVFALMQFPTLWQAIFLYAVLQGLHFVVGNIIAPRMQARSLNMDPLVVLLSLAFWGWLWGVIGMFLSTPLTVIVMVICAQFPGSRWVAVLLSADGRPGGVQPSKA
jgi:predicted PurR-regulated permease PerM